MQGVGEDGLLYKKKACAAGMECSACLSFRRVGIPADRK